MIQQTNKNIRATENYLKSAAVKHSIMLFIHGWYIG